MSIDNVKQFVREKYGQAALRVVSGAGYACLWNVTIFLLRPRTR